MTFGLEDRVSGPRSQQAGSRQIVQQCPPPRPLPRSEPRMVMTSIPALRRRGGPCSSSAGLLVSRLVQRRLPDALVRPHAKIFFKPQIQESCRIQRCSRTAKLGSRPPALEPVPDRCWLVYPIVGDSRLGVFSGSRCWLGRRPAGMAKSYSKDFRERVVEAVEREGMSRREAAARFGSGSRRRLTGHASTRRRVGCRRCAGAASGRRSWRGSIGIGCCSAAGRESSRCVGWWASWANGARVWTIGLSGHSSVPRSSVTKKDAGRPGAGSSGRSAPAGPMAKPSEARRPCPPGLHRRDVDQNQHEPSARLGTAWRASAGQGATPARKTLTFIAALRHQHIHLRKSPISPISVIADSNATPRRAWRTTTTPRKGHPGSKATICCSKRSRHDWLARWSASALRTRSADDDPWGSERRAPHDPPNGPCKS